MYYISKKANKIEHLLEQNKEKKKKRGRNKKIQEELDGRAKKSQQNSMFGRLVHKINMYG